MSKPKTSKYIGVSQDKSKVHKKGAVWRAYYRSKVSGKMTGTYFNSWEYEDAEKEAAKFIDWKHVEDGKTPPNGFFRRK